MDKELRKKILLGLFVTMGIVIFVIGIFLVGSKNEMFNKSFPLAARFSNANGLKNGSNVRFNGVKVGIVKKVVLINDTLVEVDMLIEEARRSFITKNVVASIISDGLMGDKMVNILPGLPASGEIVQNNDVIQSHNPLITDEVLATLNASNQNVKVITDNLKTLTSNLNSENGTIQSLYKDPEMANNLKSSFNNLNLVTGKVLQVSDALQQITTQIQHGNGAMGEIINDTTLGKKIVYTLDNLKATSDELNTVSNQLSTTMQRVNSGKGAMNMMLTDTAFSSNIQQSMNNIKTATSKLDQDLEGLKHSFLLRKYFRKKEKEKDQ